MKITDQKSSTPPSREERDFDIILFGASGYTGELIAEYLAENYGLNQPNAPLRWAIAGRNHTKLQILRARLEKIAGVQNIGKDELSHNIDIVVADSTNHEQLRQMVRRTRVIISAVGPYLRFGLPLVQACVDNHTDYVDLTGEIPFVRESIDNFHEVAQNNGTRIVHGCGFDALPSDLGTLILQDHVIAETHEPAEQVLMVAVKATSSGPSSGTAASIANIFEWAEKDQKRGELIRDPYALNDNKKGLPSQKDRLIPSLDEETGYWLAPSLLALFNTRIVRRTNELLSFYYGHDFKYDEAIRGPLVLPSIVTKQLDKLPSFFNPVTNVVNGIGAGLLALGSGSLTGLLMIPSTRDVIKNLHGYLMSHQSGKKREGCFEAIFSARRDDIEIARTTMSIDLDPGYIGTSIMVSECALALALDRGQLPDCGGVLTPAAAINKHLRYRLENTGHFKFKSENVT